MQNHPKGMKGWMELASDLHWEDHGGAWARQAPDKSWYIVKFSNMIEACGKRGAEELGFVYEAEVKRLNLAVLTEAQIKSALASCGYKIDGDVIDLGQGHILENPDEIKLCIVECCVMAGLGAPLEAFTGKARPTHVRAEARRYVERCMKDSTLVAERLARPVNAIGSTAEEYGFNNIDAAFDRGPFSPEKNLMRKLAGLPAKTEAL